MLMIESIRKHVSAWYTKVFLGLLALCFVVLWGGGDMLRQGFLGDGQNVLTIGGQTISSRDFSRELNMAMTRFQARSGQQITLAEAKKIGLFGQTLRGMIQKTLIDMEADRLGLVVTDDTVRELVKQNPMFGNGNGDFDRSRFDRFLQSIRLSEAGYLNELRGDLRRIQLIQAITGGVVAPQTMVAKLYKWQNEKRRVKVVTMTAKSIKKIPTPKEEELKSFWETNPGQSFTAPEYRTLTAISFGFKDIKVKVDSDKVREIYESRKNTDFKGKTMMQASKEIEEEVENFGREKALEDLRAQVEDMEASGATLKEVADKFKLKVVTFKDVTIRGKSKDSKAKLPSHKLKDLIMRVGFETDTDETSDTVEASNGRHLIVHVDGQTPSQKMPYESVKSDVKSKWTEARKLIQAEDDANALAKKINKEGLGALKGFKTKTVTLERQATDAPQKLGIAPNLNGRVFTLYNKRKALQLASIAEPGSLVVVLDKIIPVQAKKGSDLDAFTKQIRSTLNNDVVEQYLVTLEHRYKVEVNKKALEAFN